MTAIKNRFRVFFNYSGLLRELVARDIKVKYRGSLLGIVWSILNPLLTMVVMNIVFSTIFKSDIPNFPIYYLSGSIIFSLNSDASTDAMYSIIGNASLLKKVYVPKYLFPLSKVLLAVVNSVFSIIAMFIIMLATGSTFYPTLFLLPVAILYTALFSVGLGFFLCAIAVRFRDLCYIYGVVLYAWTFLTPIFYPASRLEGIALSLMNLNPMYHLINFNRSIVLYGVVPNLTLNLICIFMAIIMITIGMFAFYKSQKNFIYYI